MTHQTRTWGRAFVQKHVPVLVAVELTLAVQDVQRT